MFLKLLLLFIFVPWIELILLLKIGQIIGFFPTIGVIFLTGVIGAALARAQGLMTLFNIRQSLAAGKIPAREILDGALILGAALLLITPGFLTDSIGFFLLIPQGRVFLRSRLFNYLRRNFQVRQSSAADTGNDNIIDIDAEPYEDRDDAGKPGQ